MCLYKGLDVFSYSLKYIKEIDKHQHTFEIEGEQVMVNGVKVAVKLMDLFYFGLCVCLCHSLEEVFGTGVGEEHMV